MMRTPRFILQPPDWSIPTTLQIRTTPAKTGATLSIHHEKLRDNDDREAMRLHWSDVIEQLRRLIEN